MFVSSVRMTAHGHSRKDEIRVHGTNATKRTSDVLHPGCWSKRFPAYSSQRLRYLGTCVVKSKASALTFISSSPSLLPSGLCCIIAAGYPG